MVISFYPASAGFFYSYKQKTALSKVRQLL